MNTATWSCRSLFPRY